MSDATMPAPRRRHAMVIGVLSVLLVCDLGFIALHVTARTADVVNGMHRLDVEGSYAEQFQYAKEFVAAIGLATLAWRTRVLVYAAWSALFVYLLLDDWQSIHERGGTLLADIIGLQAVLGLRPQDLGELAVSVAAGGIVLGAIALAHGAAPEIHRTVSARLLGLLLMLVLFGIGVDMLHSALDHLPVKGFTVLEDGGEMIAMSLILAYIATRALPAAVRDDPR